MRQQSTSAPIRVLVSDATRFHTELLADALKRDGGLQVTTSTAGSEGLTARTDLECVDVLLMSSTLDETPGRGFEVLRGLHSSHGDVSAVMLLDSSKHEMILEAFRAGARGVFARNESMDTLCKCVRRVHEGQIWANSEQMGILVEAMASFHNVRAVDALGINLLSKREAEIVRSVAQGLTNREIAAQFNLSPHTVKNCLFRIFDKLGVSNRIELLLMTMSRDRDAQSAVQYLFENRSYVDLRDEATLGACQRAAEQGVLMAQLALAQYYSANKTNPGEAFHSHVWYLIAMQQISRACRDAAKTMSVDQVLQAEQVAASWLDIRGNTPARPSQDKARGRSSMTGQAPLEKALLD
jgi:two-component system nitrate/nitrite response regulator NarL